MREWCRKFWLCFVLVFLSSGLACQAGLKIFYIRHGETGANVKPDWKDKPKDTWPAYVGNADTFTPKGEGQVALVPQKLAVYHFDFIAVSPLWRTRNTILPYLKSANLKGEIWPELEEFGDKTGPDPLPPPSSDLFGGGKEIKLTEEEKSWFNLRADSFRRIKLGDSDPQRAADTRALSAKTIKMIRSQFGGKDLSILLVGHGTSGRALLKMLVKNDHVFDIEKFIINTGVWMAEEQSNGEFKVKILNDKPYVERTEDASVPPN